MRYAIYYLPEESSDLWRFGSGVLGYDSISAKPVDHLLLDLSEDLALLTPEPRIYGFHSTLKAPFSLARGATEAMLIDAATRLSLQLQAFTIGQLDVSILGSFIALTAQPNDALRDLAADCVKEFEPFRATMTLAERTKRLRAPLTARQAELMDAWGYPFVLDEFRFHMTLTSSLAPEKRASVRDALAKSYLQIGAVARITSFCLCVQRPGGAFRMLRRFALGQPVS